MKSYSILQPDGKTKSVRMNKRRAIKERCFNCSGWSKQDVRTCKQEDCQLHPFRLGTTKGISARMRNHAVSEYCKWCFNSARISQCTAKNCPLWWIHQKRAEKSLGDAPTKRFSRMKGQVRVLSNHKFSALPAAQGGAGG